MIPDLLQRHGTLHREAPIPAGYGWQSVHTLELQFRCGWSRVLHNPCSNLTHPRAKFIVGMREPSSHLYSYYLCSYKYGKHMLKWSVRILQASSTGKWWKPWRTSTTAWRRGPSMSLLTVTPLLRSQRKSQHVNNLASG